LRKYKLIGITGTTGAGKGQVVKILESNGYKIIDADLLARKIMENPVVLKNIACVFGEDVVKDNKLDRSLLAQRAFKSKETTNLLNSVTHPYITALFVEQIKSLVKTGETKIVFDAPQLFESNLDVLCDSVVAVVAQEETRIKRIMERDNITLEKAKERVKVQFTDEYFKENSDYVIENDGTLSDLKEQVDNVINNL
jgi:dephospho-CoA kinase